MTKLKWMAFLVPLLLAPVSGALAQGYPNKPLKLIIPYAPGGALNYTGRVVAQYLGEAIGQQVVVENRPGGGGIAGTDAVARSAPDGYTFCIMDPAIVINPTLQPNVPYDLFKQLEAVSFVASSPEVVVVSQQLPVKTLAELVEYGKANPNKLNFGSAGIGTTPHLAAELFLQRTGIKATHIPYRTIGQAFPDMISGKVQFAFSSIAGALPFTKDNRVRAIATTGLKRSPIYPDLPTVDEALLKGYEIDLWLGIFAPAGLPADVRAKLNGNLNKALKNPELVKAFDNYGLTPRGTGPEESAKILKSEYDKWKKIIVDGNIKLEN
jgi:tripartite-type tricarboxylate transporter receptor subunit TctC